MTLADLFEKELARYAVTVEAEREHHAIIWLGREIVKRYKQQQETLSEIARMYVEQGKKISQPAEPFK